MQKEQILVVPAFEKCLHYALNALFLSSKQKILFSIVHPMLSTSCESVQICTDPDRYPRISRKSTSHKYGFEIENS